MQLWHRTWNLRKSIIPKPAVYIVSYFSSVSVPRNMNILCRNGTISLLVCADPPPDVSYLSLFASRGRVICFISLTLFFVANVLVFCVIFPLMRFNAGLAL